MAVLYIGDSLFKYLRINRTASDVRFSSGARVEKLPEGMSDIKEFQGVVIHAATNNTPDESSKKVISRSNSLIDDIRKRVPDIQVFVSAILPRDVSFFPGANNDPSRLDQCNQRAMEINNYLRKRKDVIFIDHPRFGTSRQSANVQQQPNSRYPESR